MIPSQDECDFNVPEEHFLWALRNLPCTEGAPMLMHPSILKKWSRHLDDLAFIHRDKLIAMADENGYIHISQLPEQKREWTDAPRGPRHGWNPTAGWVPTGTPKAQPVQLPDIRLLTEQENQAMLAQYRAEGYIPDPPPAPDTAEELN